VKRIKGQGILTFDSCVFSLVTGSRSKNGFRICPISNELDLAYTQVSPLLLDFGYLPSEKGVYELNDRFKKVIGVRHYNHIVLGGDAFGLKELAKGPGAGYKNPMASEERFLRYCMPPDPNPKLPRFTLPPNSCDTHFHVFGPPDKFPFARGIDVRNLFFQPWRAKVPR